CRPLAPSRRTIRLPARGLSSAGCLSLRLGPAAGDPDRRHGCGDSHLLTLFSGLDGNPRCRLAGRCNHLGSVDSHQLSGSSRRRHGAEPSHGNQDSRHRASGGGRRISGTRCFGSVAPVSGSTGLARLAFGLRRRPCSSCVCLRRMADGQLRRRRDERAQTRLAARADSGRGGRCAALHFRELRLRPLTGRGNAGANPNPSFGSHASGIGWARRNRHRPGHRGLDTWLPQPERADGAACLLRDGGGWSLLPPACLGPSSHACPRGSDRCPERVDGCDPADRHLRNHSQLRHLGGCHLLGGDRVVPFRAPPPRSGCLSLPDAGTSLYHRAVLPCLPERCRHHPLSLSGKHADRVRDSRRGRPHVLHLEEGLSAMSSRRSTAGSTYMQWAKLCSTARFNLANSGMAGFPLAELDVNLSQLDINGPSIYGYEPLLAAIARRYRVPQESVVSAVGTSLANYLALAAATEPGDEVLVEQPTYDPLLAVAGYLGLEIKRFLRRPEQDFAVDLDDLKRNLSPRTRVIVLCNLHNPSGAFIPDSVMREVAALARRSGAYVLVDEVYREMTFSAEPQTAFHLDPDRFLITSSLTKAYGLSGLRCGWILAPKELAARIWRLHDIHCGTYAYP